MSEILVFLNDFTLRNVALGAALLGVTSGVLGCFALLRQQSLLGDTLSHAALPGVALGFLAAGSRQTIPILLGALLSGALAALLVILLTRRSRLKTDAALGIALSVFFAIGLVLLTFIQGQNNAGQAGLDAFLFGQAASILPSDIVVMALVTAFALLLVAGFWKEFQIMTFDPEFGGSLGMPVLALEILMTVMIAFAIVIGLQLVGVVLMASMLIAPAAAARQWSRTLAQMVGLSALFGALSGVSGALISATQRGLATGPLIVIMASLIVLLSLFFAPNRGLVWGALEARRNHLRLRSQQVLVDLYKLAQLHENPQYPSEIGMISSYYGQNPTRLLRRLESRGLVKSSEHMREEGEHWLLTSAGQREAEAMLESLSA